MTKAHVEKLLEDTRRAAAALSMSHPHFALTAFALKLADVLDEQLNAPRYIPCIRETDALQTEYASLCRDPKGRWVLAIGEEE